MKKTEILPDKFEGGGQVKGFFFKKIKQHENIYIYEKTFEDTKSYEVFIADIYAKLIDFDKRIYSETEFKHSYPKIAKFGVSAWDFRDFNKALDTYYHLIEKMQNNEV